MNNKLNFNSLKNIKHQHAHRRDTEEMGYFIRANFFAVCWNEKKINE